MCFSSLQLLGDDVQPFLLDEEFDYDNVALTPKFSEAELKAITELSEEKKTGTDVKSAWAEDWVKGILCSAVEITFLGGKSSSSLYPYLVFLSMWPVN